MTEATAGTWASAPTEISCWPFDLPVPHSAGTRITSDQAGTAGLTIIYNSAIDDPYNMLNTTTGVWTVNKAGIWTVLGSALFSSVASGGANSKVDVKKGGSTVVGSFYMTELGSSPTISVGTIAMALRLAAGDTIEIAGTGDAAYNIDAGIAKSNHCCLTYQGP